jgi:hypothetical protein
MLLRDLLALLRFAAKSSPIASRADAPKLEESGRLSPGSLLAWLHANPCPIESWLAMMLALPGISRLNLGANRV